SNTRTVDVQVARLRHKIETDPRAPDYLQTARGRGYLLRID
ncbi:MAG: helix-turn-helix domain-containing protein, partial [Alphaproteobacteria bacterium]|nr:helix-turn-helix domain-containing protein [Alphaproteobacteria bacterium]